MTDLVALAARTARTIARHRRAAAARTRLVREWGELLGKASKGGPHLWVVQAPDEEWHVAVEREPPDTGMRLLCGARSESLRLAPNSLVTCVTCAGVLAERWVRVE